MQQAYGRFAEVYDRLMSDVDYDAWAAYLHTLIGRFQPGIEEHGQILHECACGTGSLTMRLAAMGYSLSVSDTSADMLRVAQEKTMRAGYRIPLIRQDMRALQLHQCVDVVIAACDAINYLLDKADLTAFLLAAKQNLKPGGLLLFDYSSEHKLACILGGATFGEDDGEVAYLWKNAYDTKRRFCEMRISFFVKEGKMYRRFTERHVQRAYRSNEIYEALQKTGYVDAECFDAFSFAPETGTSERIQWAARRGT